MDKRASIFLVLPVPAKIGPDEIYVEKQASNGLDRWADNFDHVTVAFPTIPDDLANASLSMRWKSAEQLEHRKRIEIICLPWAYTPWRFARTLPSTFILLQNVIQRSSYLSFAISGLIGDWASVACIAASFLERRYSVWTDRVESEVLRNSLDGMPFLKRICRASQVSLMHYYHRELIRRSHLGLFHGMDSFVAYSKFSKNPHCVHNIHLKKSDEISEEDLDRKCQSVLVDRPLQICYVGRLDASKGPEDWLDVMFELVKHDVRFMATWYGEGPLRAELEKKLDRLKLRENVKLSGYIADSVVLGRKIQESDMLLFCHKTPESPRCLLESLVKGTPIVGYRSAFSEDITSKHGGSVLTDKNNVSELAKAIVTLSIDRQKLAELFRCAASSGKGFNDEDVFRHRSNLIKENLPRS